MTAARRMGRWSSFVRIYGWRAYALVALSVLTIVAIVHTTTSPADDKRVTVEGKAQAGFVAAAQPVKQQSLAQPVTLVGPPEAASDAKLGDDAINCATNDYSRLVVVSISHQHLWACEGARQVRSTAVTTGKITDNDQTPLGSWRVQAKQRDRYLVGEGYKDYVQYWIPFNGDFGLHDASWQTMPFGASGWKTEGSHGCVHLPTSEMAWLYSWSTVESTVVTIEA
jgi:lipoprotein-anchoring transpeptidase ErfK/SrfK